MDWSQIYLDTFIPELPKYWNQNFLAFQRYLNVFYDASRGILLKPIETTGRVKGARGEFVTAVVDNLVVKNQWTNLYENYTTADSEYVSIYNGLDVSTRVSTDSSVWPYEPSTYSWVNVNQPYYKINNDSSLAFQNNNLGQEFQIIFDTSSATSGPYTILIDSSEGGVSNLSVTYANAPKTWIKLITIAYDASWGATWAVKQYGGDYTIA